MDWHGLQVLDDLPCNGTAVWDPRRGDCIERCCREFRSIAPHRPWHRFCLFCPCWWHSRTSRGTSPAVWRDSVLSDVDAAPAACVATLTVCSPCSAPADTKCQSMASSLFHKKFIDPVPASGRPPLPLPIHHPR